MFKSVCKLVAALLIPLTMGMSSANEACSYKSSSGTYSSFSSHPESGDLLGIEITVLWARGSYYTVFQSSEGEPTVPVIAKADVKDGNIHFILPPESPYREFKGVITPCSVTGSFVGGQLSPIGEKEFTLEKKNSYWHR